MQEPDGCTIALEPAASCTQSSGYSPLAHWSCTPLSRLTTFDMVGISVYELVAVSVILFSGLLFVGNNFSPEVPQLWLQTIQSPESTQSYVSQPVSGGSLLSLLSMIRANLCGASQPLDRGQSRSSGIG